MVDFLKNRLFFMKFIKPPLIDDDWYEYVNNIIMYVRYNNMVIYIVLHLHVVRPFISMIRGVYIIYLYYIIYYLCAHHHTLHCWLNK